MNDDANIHSPVPGTGGDASSISMREAGSAALSALGHRLSATQTARQAAEVIFEAADRLLGWDACLLDVYSPEQDILTHVLHIDMAEGKRAEFEPAHKRRPVSPLARKAIREGGQLILKADPTRMQDEGAAFGNTSRPSASILLVPIRNGAEVTGILAIHSYTPGAYTEQSLATLQALADHCGGTLARIRMGEAVQRRLEMESLISALSASFVNASPAEINAPIDVALERLGKFTAAQHCCIFHSRGSRRVVRQTRHWQAEGTRTCAYTCVELLSRESSWWWQELQRSDVIRVPRLSALPAEARAEKRLFKTVGIKSTIAVPLRYGGSLLGFLQLSSRDSEHFWVDEHISLLQIAASLLANALQHQSAAQRILRLNRLYSVLSRINELIVRTPPREFLCEQACRILVEAGLFRMAAVGMVESNSPAIKFISHWGAKDGMLGDLRLSAAADVPEGQGPTGTAVRENRYDFCPDVTKEPRMQPWRELFATHDCQSAAAFPLRVKGRAVGALTLFGAERYSVSEEEIRLLEQFSADLSFAIEHSGQAQQLQVQGAALESAANAIAITDPRGMVLWVNPAFSRLTGYSLDEVIGKRTSVLKSGRHDEAFYRRMWETISAGRVWHDELVNRRKDGSFYAEEMTITPVLGANGGITHYIAIKQDISERKRAESRNLALSQLGHRLGMARSVRSAAEIILTAADELLGLDACTLDLYSAERDRLSHVLNWDTVDGRRVECPKVYGDEPPTPRMRRALTSGPQLIFQDPANGIPPATKPFGNVARPSASIMFVPMRDGAQVIGVISVHSYTANAYDQQSLGTLQALADHCAGALGRIRAQEALSESEANYRLAFERSPDAIFVHTEGRFVMANPAALQLVHADGPEQIIGRSVLDIVPSESREVILRRIQCATEREPTPLLEQMIVRLDGTTVEIEATGIPFKYQGKAAVQTVMREITERKQAVTRLSAFSALGHRLSAAQTARDAARTIVEVADQLLGWDACSLDLYSAEENLIRPVLDMDLVDGQRVECPSTYESIPPTALLKRAIEDGGQLILRQGSEESVANLLLFGNTARRSESLMFVPIRNGAVVIGVISIQSYKRNAYDQASLETLEALGGHCGGALQRIKTQEELRWKTAFLEAQVSSSADGILVVDAQGRHILENQRLCELWKIPATVALKENETEHVRFVAQFTRNPEQFVQRAQYLYAHPTEVGRDEVELLDGTVLDRYSAPVVGGDGTYYGRLWTFRDITESRRLEAQLRQSQKMEAIGQLAGGVAHDFNNLLAVIRGNSELALMGAPPLSDQATECLKQVVAASERAAGLTRQLLAFGRKQVMQLQPLDLAEVVGHLAKMLKRLIGEDVDLQLRYAGRLPLVMADAGMVEQVLLNLAVNARDAMPQGGKLIVGTEAVQLDATLAREHPQGRAGSFVCLSVTDTGVGIPPENLQHIFEPFYTTKEVGKGSGLGLATVYGIVEQHKGWVEVSSRPGDGTTFRIFLPATDVPAPVPLAEAEAKPRGGREMILLVEDDEPVRRLTRRLLENSGYRVREAASGREALELTRKELAEVDLLLTDVVMPSGVSGRQLAEHLIVQRPDLKIIFMSGYSGDALGKDTTFLQRTNGHFLPKPCPAHELLSTVRGVLDRPQSKAE